MNKTDNKKQLKYSILDELKKLPQAEYKISRNKLPLALGVSPNTFKMWLYISINDNRQIPLKQLAIIAKYLNTSIENLLNEKTPNFSYKDLKELEDETTQAEFNL